MDQIIIGDLRVVATVGALAHERQQPQPLRIDLVVHADLSEAGRTDELGATVDYGSVASRVAELAAATRPTLLERLAEEIAGVVLGFDRVDAVDVTVTKLRPPIPLGLDSTAVVVRRRSADLELPDRARRRALLALGTNLGDREGYLRLAIDALEGVVATSQVFETSPVGGPTDQGAYLNMAVEIETSLDPFALLRRCQRIEALADRQRTVRWGPRTLDVDLLFHGDAVISSPELTLPHPRLAERRFVLAPLEELAPERCPPDWRTSLPPDDVVPRGPLAAR